MHIHCFQHDDYEDLDYIGEWAGNTGFTTSYTRFDLGESPPPVTSFDWLVVMGGHMGAYEDEAFGWLTREKACIREAIDAEKPVLGICLGSQLIAASLGARVYRNDVPEIGFHRVTFNGNAACDPVFSNFPAELSVLHWHNDTFELPQGAVNMARSAVTSCQAFRYSHHVFALQFHPEITEKRLPGFVREGEHEITESQWVQQADVIMEQSGLCNSNNLVFGKVLDSMLQSYREWKK